MSRQLKRHSDQISRDDSSEPESTPPPARRQRRHSTSSSPSNADGTPDSSRDSAPPPGQNIEHVLTKKLVRLALATEYARTPLRRSDISAKIFKDATTTHGSRISFQKVFDAANNILQDTFGMRMEELPSKEKTTLKERRNLASQAAGKSSSSSSSKQYILISTLPPELKTNPAIMQPTRAPDARAESEYTALYTMILSLIMLNNSSLPDSKLERYLKRMNAEVQTPLGNKDKLLQRMIKDGYLERRRDTSSGEEVIEWVPGPRGKLEVGVSGVVGLVRSVYGYGAVELAQPRNANRNANRRGDDEDEEEEDVEETTHRLSKIEEDELHQKLSRSLGIKIGQGGSIEAPARGNADEGNGERSREGSARNDDQPGPSRRGGGAQKGRASQRAGGGRRRRDDDDSD
jgi:melanoma-associated antigen